MIEITIKADTTDELIKMWATRDHQRDALRDHISRLEATPLQFSLANLANAVLEMMPGLTPDQASRLRTLIAEEGQDLCG